VVVILLEIVDVSAQISRSGLLSPPEALRAWILMEILLGKKPAYWQTRPRYEGMRHQQLHSRYAAQASRPGMEAMIDDECRRYSTPGTRNYYPFLGTFGVRSCQRVPAWTSDCIMLGGGDELYTYTQGHILPFPKSNVNIASLARILLFR
jgi:hypothetical protein